MATYVVHVPIRRWSEVVVTASSDEEARDRACAKLRAANNTLDPSRSAVIVFVDGQRATISAEDAKP